MHTMAGLFHGKRNLTFGIKVSEIPDSIDEHDLKLMFKKFGTISSVHVKNSKPLKHAYINYESQHSANRAAEKMNRYEVNGGTIKVKAQGVDEPDHKRHKPTSSNTTSELSDSLSNSKHHSGTHTNVNQFSVKISNINPSTTQVVLSELFKTTVTLNTFPGSKSYAYANYKSQQEMENASQLHNTILDGLKIQVKIANSSKNTNLLQNQHLIRDSSKGAQRIVPVDGVKLLHILKMLPSLKANILKDFGVSIHGFQPGSTKLILSGPSQSLDESHVVITRILDGHSVTTETCIGLLIPSAQKRISLENLPAILCAHTENGKDFCYAEVFSKSQTRITLFICGPENVPLKVKKILKSPEEKNVSLTSPKALQKLKEYLGCDFLDLLHRYGVYVWEHVHTNGCSLTVQGYVEGEVDTAFSILSNAAAKCKMFPSSRSASHPRMSHHPQPSCKPMVSYSPRESHSQRSRIVCSKTFQYECHPNFKVQIQQCIIKPLKKQLSVDVFMSSIGSTKTAWSGKSSEGSIKDIITIQIKSSSSKDFSIGCERLEELKPKNKCCVWPKEEFEFLSRNMRKEVREVEQCNHVYVQFKDKENSTVIYGFSVDNVSMVEDHLRYFVDSKLEVELFMPVTHYQNLFLQTKHEKTLCELCEIRFPTNSKFQSDHVNLILRGTKMKVNMAKEKVCEITGMLKVRSLECRYDSYGKMWKRVWHKVQKKGEAAYHVVMDVHAVVDDCTSKNAADIGLTVNLAIIGKDLLMVTEAESTINSMKTELLHKTVNLNSVHFEVAVDGINSKKIFDAEKWAVEVEFDWERHAIELITPIISSEDLNAAYKTVMDYVNDAAHCIDLVCLQNSSLHNFLQCNQQKWQQFVTIAKRHSVWIKLLHGAIKVFGKSENVTKAKKSILDKLQKISRQFEVRTIKVDELLEPVLDTTAFKGVIAKVRQDHGVTLSYTKCEVVHSIKVKTLDDSLLTIEICRGNILSEVSDAIVNLVNCNTLHKVDLAEELINAGGTTIQQEFDLYLKTYGPVDLCEPICLGSGYLNCKLLIHVKPVLKVYGPNGEIVGLDKAMNNVLLLAERHVISSLSIPLFDLHALSECAKTSLKVTLDLCIEGSFKHLKSVRFVLPTMELANEFEQKLLELQSKIPSGVVESPKDQSFIWVWENDFGCLEPYSAENSAYLSHQFCLKSQASKLVIKGNSYTIDYSKMVQVNDQTSKSRRIERRKLQPIWKYKNDKDHWDLYTEKQSQAIEAMWQNKTSSVIEIGSWEYTFSFDTTPMTQRNVVTKRARSICRMDCDGTQNRKPSDGEQISLMLEGPKETLDQAENEIEEFFNSNLVIETISLATTLPSDIVNEIGARHNVELKSFTPSQVVFKGLRNNVVNATVDIKDALLRDYKAVSFPPEWEPQSEELELKELNSVTPEWSIVSQHFHCTLRSAKIIKIERVQKKWLWEKYFRHSERMKTTNGGIINEKLLFHGTRTTPPSSIYRGEEGFDMRFSKAGMWGTGNYFAADASYSDGYAHHLPNTRIKQMFLAKVLTGNSIQLHSNHTLRLPPVKEKLRTGDIRYDTVRGNTGGSDVYIAYSNEKAYPFYLISYM